MNKTQLELIKVMQDCLPYAVTFDRNDTRQKMEALCGIVNSGLANASYQDKDVFKLKLTLSGKEYNNPDYYKTNPASYGLV